MPYSLASNLRDALSNASGNFELIAPRTSHFGLPTSPATPTTSRIRGSKRLKAVYQRDGFDLVMEPVAFAAWIDDPGAVE